MTVTRHKFRNSMFDARVRSQLRFTYIAEKQKLNQHEDKIHSEYSDRCFFTQSFNHNASIRSISTSPNLYIPCTCSCFSAGSLDQTTKMIFLFQTAVLFLYICISYYSSHLGILGVCRLRSMRRQSTLVNVKDDHRSIFSNLSNWKEEA